MSDTQKSTVLSLDNIAKAMKLIQQNASYILLHNDPTSPEFRLAFTSVQLVATYARAVQTEKSYAVQEEVLNEIVDITKNRNYKD